MGCSLEWNLGSEIGICIKTGMETGIEYATIEIGNWDEICDVSWDDAD